MEIPDWRSTLQQSVDAERDKFSSLTGDEHATQWIERTVACLAAIIP
ncbi:hypothetical protein V2J94_43800 [Streptomyces sp. DSM 41524]|uniref:Uncharacterized protein n=1 Tax=Streptomyces asiaticus subsp. ignotus TaxID=3098222 RepID=A0ABU7QBE5_9ACTN|nr:hypothetical protein [Streptomyces sp. DSM 41524]